MTPEALSAAHFSDSGRDRAGIRVRSPSCVETFVGSRTPAIARGDDDGLRKTGRKKKGEVLNVNGMEPSRNARLRQDGRLRSGFGLRAHVSLDNVPVSDLGRQAA